MKIVDGSTLTLLEAPRQSFYSYLCSHFEVKSVGSSPKGRDGVYRARPAEDTKLALFCFGSEAMNAPAPGDCGALVALLCVLASVNCTGPAEREREPRSAFGVLLEEPTTRRSDASAGVDGGEFEARRPRPGTAAIETENAEQPVLPLALPQGTTVLHIGDSFAGALGIALNRGLKQAGLRGILRFKTSTFIPTWAWGKQVPLYIAQYKPDLVLITLGGNELKIKTPEQRAGGIKKLVQKLNGTPCVWIAPPLWAGDTGLLPVIRNNCAPCRYMDTNSLISEMARLRDKIHPTMQAREEWAEVVLRWLAEQRSPTEKLPWALKPEI